jgi:hypothetical protein
VIEVFSPDDIRPIVLIDDYLLRAGQDKVASQLDFFGLVDDVYSKDFAETIVVVDTGADLLETTTAASVYSSVLHSRANSSIPSLPSGPYFLRGSNIHQAWRLYRDELDAFIFGVVPQDVLKPQTCVAHMERFWLDTDYRQI